MKKVDYPYLHGILATHTIQKLLHENPFFISINISISDHTSVNQWKIFL